MENIERTPKTKLNIDENTNMSLEDTCKLQAHKIEELTAKLNWYEEQFKLSQQKRFGASSEQTIPDQLSIFNEAEKESCPKARRKI